MFIDKKKKETPIIVQCGIYAIILFVAQLISSLFPASFSAPRTVNRDDPLIYFTIDPRNQAPPGRKARRLHARADCLPVRSFRNPTRRKYAINED